MLFVALLNLVLTSSFAQSNLQNGIEPDWSSQATIDSSVFPNGRANIYQWDEQTFSEKIARGQKHALHYPVTATGLLIPARPALKVLDSKPGEPLFALMKTIFSLSSEFKDFKGFWDWLGLTPSTKESGEIYPMGVSLITRNGVEGFTMSCAACHSSSLFGKSILGMTNRFPRANLFFKHGQEALSKISPILFQLMTGASRGEKEMYADAVDHIRSITIKKPETLGLDTSLSQVAQSLAKRAPTENAERTEYDLKYPRPTSLDEVVADSKPAVWWNVKYKTHWLSDGSVVSGNPVFTNFLWNEIGRGVDIPVLLDWLKSNPETVQELTTAVFATEAPKWKDFFGENSIQVERAKRGEAIYAQNCAHCHGEYKKAWSLTTSEWEDLHEQAVKNGKPMPAIIDTIRLSYTEKVKDVGTDSGRRKGMKALAEALNPLAFSKNFKILIEEQPGYVASPLEGIWARYPYFHNNSIPNLCALMTEPSSRPAVYYSGKAIDKDRDYDQECLGYPVGNKTPAEWKKDPEYRYDTKVAGLSNSGHYDRIFMKDGVERYSPEEKKDLLEFLKTL
jgi:mono/diheme cytochrome c family protein